MLKPWMALYTGEFLNQTAHLSAEETGAYIRLLIACWQHRDLPDDDARLARVAGVPVDSWQLMKPTLRALFDQEGWSLKRLEEIRSQADETHRRLSEAGRKRWADRAPSSLKPTARSKQSSAQARLKQTQPQTHALPEMGKETTRARKPIPRFSNKEEALDWLRAQDVFPGDLDDLAEKAVSGSLTWDDVHRSSGM